MIGIHEKHKILTPKGFTIIGELKEGDKVLSYDINKQLLYHNKIETILIANADKDLERHVIENIENNKTQNIISSHNMLFYSKGDNIDRIKKLNPFYHFIYGNNKVNSNEWRYFFNVPYPVKGNIKIVNLILNNNKDCGNYFVDNLLIPSYRAII